MVACIQGTPAKAEEWSTPIVVLVMDVAAAFDHLRPEHMAAEMAARGATAAQIAAVLREAVGAGQIAGRPTSKCFSSLTPLPWPAAPL